MLFLMRPRPGGGEDTNDGIKKKYVRTIYEKSKPRRAPSRVRVLKRRLKELKGEVVKEPEVIEILNLPEEVEQKASELPDELRLNIEAALMALLRKEFLEPLMMLETVQVNERRLLELWNQLEEEEIVVLMVMS